MLKKREEEYREELVEVGRRLYERGLLVAGDGNISVRINEEEVLISPSGVCKGFINPLDIPKVNLKGEIIEGIKKPARDIRMHLAIYCLRPEVKAIVHAHPPVATGFAIARQPVKITSPEVVFNLGDIVMTDYAAPTTEQVPQVVEEALVGKENCGALLLANHGAVTMGLDLMDAFYKMESLEMFLQATLVARLLGNECELTADQLAEIRTLAFGK